jgi:hypothetical protein
MKEDKPYSIEKRIFTCESCGYQVQVYGEAYFDYGCMNYMAVFKCKKCKVLFESVISKMYCYDLASGVTYDLADKEDILCLNCGTTENNVWNKESGVCPKCEGEMIYTTEGEIKVEYEKNR